MNKKDYQWLERHTSIENQNATIDDCLLDDLQLKLHRPHHLAKLKSIFPDNDIKIQARTDNLSLQVQVKGMTIDSFYQTAVENNAELIFNETDGKIYFIPCDKNKYHRIFRRSSALLLSNLSTNKKLDILYSFRQQLFPTEKQKENNDNFIIQNQDKFTALLQLKIPQNFIEKEKQKIRLITAKIAQIPNVKHDMENFSELSENKKEKLFSDISKITAEINGIQPPKINFLTTEQIEKDEGLADWIDTDAYTYQDIICIDKQKMEKYDGIYMASIIFHETNHIAQSHGDYSQFPLMEDMLSENLDYPLQNSELYIFTPQEMITYTAEKYFIEQIIKQTDAQTSETTLSSAPEQNLAEYYTAKALKRSY